MTSGDEQVGGDGFSDNGTYLVLSSICQNLLSLSSDHQKLWCMSEKTLRKVNILYLPLICPWVVVLPIAGCCTTMGAQLHQHGELGPKSYWNH